MNVGTAKIARRCNHPELIVINGPKPGPVAVIYHCKCGANWSCPVCGWGAGQSPCRCDLERVRTASY